MLRAPATYHQETISYFQGHPFIEALAPRIEEKEIMKQLQHRPKYFEHQRLAPAEDRGMLVQILSPECPGIPSLWIIPLIRFTVPFISVQTIPVLPMRQTDSSWPCTTAAPHLLRNSVIVPSAHSFNGNHSAFPTGRSFRRSMVTRSVRSIWNPSGRLTSSTGISDIISSPHLISSEKSNRQMTLITSTGWISIKANSCRWLRISTISSSIPIPVSTWDQRSRKHFNSILCLSITTGRNYRFGDIVPQIFT